MNCQELEAFPRLRTCDSGSNSSFDQKHAWSTSSDSGKREADKAPLRAEKAKHDAGQQKSLQQIDGRIQVRRTVTQIEKT